MLNGRRKGHGKYELGFLFGRQKSSQCHQKTGKKTARIPWVPRDAKRVPKVTQGPQNGSPEVDKLDQNDENTSFEELDIFEK